MTRRERFLKQRAKNLRMQQKYYGWRWETYFNPVTGKNGKRLRDVPPRGPKQHPVDASGKTYAASTLPPLVPPVLFSVSDATPASPPHLKILSPWYIAMRAADQHLSGALIRFHARRVKSSPRPRNHKQTKLTRRITGCNYFYFHNQCFPNGDVLDRHPQEVDIDNGAPLGPAGWPVPLGY